MDHRMRLSSLRLSFSALIAAAAVTYLIAGAAVPAGAALGTIDTEARNAYILDFNTGAVLLDKGANQHIPPASMSKIMTAYVVFGYLKRGKLSLEDMLPVSEKAWRTQGSKMFVPLGGQVKVEDLLRGMIIQSGNDACIVLAEGVAGSEEAFVEQMNETAQKLGLKDSHFTNVSGLPDPNEYMTAHDLAVLATRLITDFPEYFHYDSEKDFTYNGIKQGNRNPLLYKDLGADGMKTGHTDEAGYCLTATVMRNGRRIIMVLAGMPSMKARGTESERLIEWAYREFNDYTLVKAGAEIDEAPVWMGVTATVPAGAAKDVVVTLPRNARRDLKVTAVYDGPAKAPVAQGAPVGQLMLTMPNLDPVTIPLVAIKPVDRLGALGRVAFATSYMLFGRRN
jgi:D-alanyl-D-alanine carboxypeptidase (penicillin-binding protein 5/6)